MMNEMLALCRGALTRDAKTFDDLRQSPDVFRKGFTLVLVLGLIVGFVLGLVGTVQGLLTNPAEEIAKSRADFAQTMKTLSQFMPPEMSRQVLENYNMGLRIGERVVRETKTPLPRPVGVLFQQLGASVSYPFGWLGSLIFYGALVHIFAKLLGGRGSIAQMLGVTSLTVVPHILDALGFIPCLGALLGLIAFVWGVPIYIKGTAAAQEMTLGKATLAVFLPIILLFVIALLLIVLFIILIVASIGR